ncbi:MAG: prolyl oligopeptidase family serine peptidase, partial [Bacteroidales bacterium]|nr:prolyl oligopeptidase family serine peptidase [Bacteroidales bacterium]
SKRIGFYKFDNSKVPMFPIYSAFANPSGAASQSQSPRVTDLSLGGSLSETRYPKAGQTNPEVKIGIVEVSFSPIGTPIKWADFDPKEDQYFGIPFWGPDSQEFFVARMPRLQNTMDLYSVNAKTGAKKHIYHETYKTWLNWIDSPVFTDKGLYMVRDFETGWQQIYFLSYDGKTFRRLTSGTNWSMTVLRVDEKRGEVYFTAKRDASVRQALCKVDRNGVIRSLTDPAYNVQSVSFSPDGKYFVAAYSNVTTPTRVGIFPTSGGVVSKGHNGLIAEANLATASSAYKPRVVADMQGPDYDESKYALGQLVHMTTSDGFTLPAMIVYPKDFNETKKYPVHVDIYGGPDTPLVRDRWVTPTAANQWYSENGIIQITVDPRAGGHNGREGLDMIYRQLTVNEVKDFCEWADWLQSMPFVIDEKIGVEGFSFGGTMTCMLLMQAPDKFHYGIAGGGVYDWSLYDSHYTERYMDTPQNNPEGYSISRVLNYVEGYPTDYTSNVISSEASSRTSVISSEASSRTSVISSEASSRVEKSVLPVMLKLTHGTGDDNVHHQNTLQLLDALHRHGKRFDFMIYPDGMHGYRGYQGTHFQNANNAFWLQYLKNE